MSLVSRLAPRPDPRFVPPPPHVSSATKRRADGARSSCDTESEGLRAKRSRRLLELVDEYGEDENFMGVVEVVAGGVVHRMNPLLLAQSDVFRGMLTSGLREATQRRIELPDMSAACWQALRRYLKSGDARVESPTVAVEVLQAAHMYELPPLAGAVEERIADACDEGECEKDDLLGLLDLAEALQYEKLAASAARALIVDFQATEKALAADAAGPLPGGYDVGEKVFFTMGNLAWARNKVSHGQVGEVSGRATSASVAGKGVAVLFPGNKSNVDCYLNQLSRTPPPPLPGGYAAGDRVFYTAESCAFPNGDRLPHGQAGEVMGHPRSDSPHFGEGVCVRFPGNEGNLSVWLANLSRTPPPPLPGGYAVGERVFYTGSTKTVSTGDKYTECQAGEVTGPATNATYVGKGVAVLFPGNKASINCRLAKLSRTEPSWASI